jgi:hypothetical protein
MSEIIMTPQSEQPLPSKLYIIDDQGKEITVPVEDAWLYGPDSLKGNTTILDMADLPKDQWREQGDNDE